MSSLLNRFNPDQAKKNPGLTLVQRVIIGYQHTNITLKKSDTRSNAGSVRALYFDFCFANYALCIILKSTNALVRLHWGEN